MKRMLVFLLIVVSVLALWYLSIVYVTDRFGVPDSLTAIGEMFGGVNSLFSGLALSGIVFALWVLMQEVRGNQQDFEKTLQTNKLSLEVIALSSLIQECDTTLHRYDRWESAGIKGDYATAKADVREKMNTHKEQLEKKLLEIQSI